ncbi:phage major capsid protein [Pelomonas sp. HMWF004]|nr:phage major capsid protein [Pelomonas sp. HMWF004]
MTWPRPSPTSNPSEIWSASCGMQVASAKGPPPRWWPASKPCSASWGSPTKRAPRRSSCGSCTSASLACRPSSVPENCPLKGQSMLTQNPNFRLALRLALCAIVCALMYAGWAGGADASAGVPIALASAGALDFSQVMKALEGVETKLKNFDEKAAGELKTMGEVSRDTKTAVDTLGTEQRVLADRLLQLEQKGLLPNGGKEKADDSWGAQFVKGCTQEQRLALVGDSDGSSRKSVGYTVKNTITNTVGSTFSDRKPGIVGGAFRRFTLEALLSTVPTSANAVDYVRENVFTNNAAEAAEGAVLAESAVTTTPVTEAVSTIGHFLKISKQLAADNAMLAAYINLRLRYGVDLRVENQIWAGNGTAPNMSGFIKAGNFTAHGYSNASLIAAGVTNNRFDLIGKMIGDSELGDYPADAIVLNPADWWTMRLAKDSQGRYILGDPGAAIERVLFDRPVVTTAACTAGNVGVLSLGQSSTFYNREGVQIDMSEHDGDNFQRLLITLRAVRRCMLAVERPAAVRYGALVPA